MSFFLSDRATTTVCSCNLEFLSLTLIAGVSLRALADVPRRTFRETQTAVLTWMAGARVTWDGIMGVTCAL